MPPWMGTQSRTGSAGVTLTQFLKKGVEDFLTVVRKAPEDKHGLRYDGVDNVADFLVVEQQMDELRDLDVINCDGIATRVRVMTSSSCLAPSSFKPQAGTP